MAGSLLCSSHTARVSDQAALLGHKPRGRSCSLRNAGGAPEPPREAPHDLTPS